MKQNNNISSHESQMQQVIERADAIEKALAQYQDELANLSPVEYEKRMVTILREVNTKMNLGLDPKQLETLARINSGRGTNDDVKDLFTKGKKDQESLKKAEKHMDFTMHVMEHSEAQTRPNSQTSPSNLNKYSQIRQGLVKINKTLVQQKAIKLNNKEEKGNKKSRCF